MIRVWADLILHTRHRTKSHAAKWSQHSELFTNAFLRFCRKKYLFWLTLTLEKERYKNHGGFSNEHFAGYFGSELMSFEKGERSWIINGPLCGREKASRFCWSHGLIFWHNNWEDVRAATRMAVSDIRSLVKWRSSSHLLVLLGPHWLHCIIIAHTNTYWEEGVGKIGDIL